MSLYSEKLFHLSPATLQIMRKQDVVVTCDIQHNSVITTDNITTHAGTWTANVSESSGNACTHWNFGKSA